MFQVGDIIKSDDGIVGELIHKYPSTSYDEAAYWIKLSEPYKGFRAGHKYFAYVTLSQWSLSISPKYPVLKTKFLGGLNEFL